jgi:hydroxypyruvate reductase
MTTGEKALETLHDTAVSIFRDAVDACRIDTAFDHHIRFEGTKLIRPVAHGDGPVSVDLKDFKRIFVIAIGKAANPMLETLLSRMDRRQGLRGVCCSREIPEQRNWRIRYFEGGHPLPSEGSFAAARAALALLRKARKDTLAIFLISGGASALFDLPLDPDISLEDTMAMHQALIASGAPISEVNTVRKHFSAVKGGRLAQAAGEATKLSILLPDVPLRSLDALASGPTSPDHTTVKEARAVVLKYDLTSRFPASVNTFFLREDLPESPGNKTRRPTFLPRFPWTESPAVRKPAPCVLNAEDPVFIGSMFEVLLSSHDLVENARVRAVEAGYYTVVDNS